MEFIYPAGAHNWKIKITPKCMYRGKSGVAKSPCDMRIVDTHDMKEIFHCDYQSEDKCLEVWESLRRDWENGRCYWDDQLRRLVWKSELEFYKNAKDSSTR